VDHKCTIYLLRHQFCIGSQDIGCPEAVPDGTLLSIIEGFAGSGTSSIKAGNNAGRIINADIVGVIDFHNVGAVVEGLWDG
jgi:hypothetical protein